ncbi:MAG: DUF3419 family protein [Clostridiales bacterium]|nr:DUF3419 family protein [Clostridiales bacterium]
MNNYEESRSEIILDDWYNFEEEDNLTYQILNMHLYNKRIKDIRDRCYITSNEYLCAFMHKKDFEGKRVATVGSSGDQLLNALYLGAKDVTLIDANKFTRAFTEYKMAMIKNLSYDEFISILQAPQLKLFSLSLYRRISQDLSRPAQEFWDRLFLEYDKDSFTANPTSFYSELIQDSAMIGGSAFTNTEEAYNHLQDVLHKGDYQVDYITADVFEFDNKLKGKFDVILLSNIYDYVPANQYIPLLYDLYDHKLNPNGVMQIDYVFSAIMPSSLKEYFRDFNYYCDWGGFMLRKPRENNKDYYIDESMEAL